MRCTTTFLAITGVTVDADGPYNPGRIGLPIKVTCNGFSHAVMADLGEGVSTVVQQVSDDLTAVTLTVDISGGASTGSRTLTMRNPDGPIVPWDNALTVS
jgi:hypothetical protein